MMVRRCPNPFALLDSGLTNNILLALSCGQIYEDFGLLNLEKEADAFSKKVLHGVVNDYGEDSINVNKVGGTRLSERAKPMTKEKKAMIAEKKALKTT